MRRGLDKVDVSQKESVCVRAPLLKHEFALAGIPPLVAHGLTAPECTGVLCCVVFRNPFAGLLWSAHAVRQSRGGGRRAALLCLARTQRRVDRRRVARRRRCRARQEGACALALGPASNCAMPHSLLFSRHQLYFCSYLFFFPQFRDGLKKRGVDASLAMIIKQRVRANTVDRMDLVR